MGVVTSNEYDVLYLRCISTYGSRPFQDVPANRDQTSLNMYLISQSLMDCSSRETAERKNSVGERCGSVLGGTFIKSVEIKVQCLTDKVFIHPFISSVNHKMLQKHFFFSVA